MLAEILSRMEPVAFQEASPGDSLPDSSHSTAPGIEMPPFRTQGGPALLYSHLRGLFG